MGREHGDDCGEERRYDTQPSKHVQFNTEECADAEEKCTGSQRSFKGPIIDVALIACGMSWTLFLSQNGTSRESFDNASPVFRTLPLNVKYVVNIKDDLTPFACAHGDNYLLRQPRHYC